MTYSVSAQRKYTPGENTYICETRIERNLTLSIKVPFCINQGGGSGVSLTGGREKKSLSEEETSEGRGEKCWRNQYEKETAKEKRGTKEGETRLWWGRKRGGGNEWCTKERWENKWEHKLIRHRAWEKLKRMREEYKRDKQEKTNRWTQFIKMGKLNYQYLHLNPQIQRGYSHCSRISFSWWKTNSEILLSLGQNEQHTNTLSCWVIQSCLNMFALTWQSTHCVLLPLLVGREQRPQWRTLLFRLQHGKGGLPSVSDVTVWIIKLMFYIMFATNLQLSVSERLTKYFRSSCRRFISGSITEEKHNENTGSSAWYSVFLPRFVP